MRTMVFIDHQNFNINLHEFYKRNPKLTEPKIKYPKLSNIIHNNISIDSVLLKTYLFAYKPCDLLMRLSHYKSFYTWLNGMKNKPYLEVIEGTQEVRPINKTIPININDSNTYRTEEKGTDINVAVNMLSKAYSNAYDVAVLVSGDTDYVPVVNQLHNIGKIVVLATLPHQNISKYAKLHDQHIKLTDSLLQQCQT